MHTKCGKEDVGRLGTIRPSIFVQVQLSAARRRPIIGDFGVLAYGASTEVYLRDSAPVIIVNERATKCRFVGYGVGRWSESYRILFEHPNGKRPVLLSIIQMFSYLVSRVD
jgi:hypothetical protein